MLVRYAAEAPPPLHRGTRRDVRGVGDAIRSQLLVGRIDRVEYRQLFSHNPNATRSPAPLIRRPPCGHAERIAGRANPPRPRPAVLRFWSPWVATGRSGDCASVVAAG